MTSITTKSNMIDFNDNDTDRQRNRWVHMFLFYVAYSPFNSYSSLLFFLTGMDKRHCQFRIKIKVGNPLAGPAREADFCGGDAAANCKLWCGRTKRKRNDDGILFFGVGWLDQKPWRQQMARNIVSCVIQSTNVRVGRNLRVCTLFCTVKNV